MWASLCDERIFISKGTILYNTEQNRIFILFKHIQLITITKLQNAWIIKYAYTV